MAGDSRIPAPSVAPDLDTQKGVDPQFLEHRESRDSKTDEAFFTF